MDLKYFLFCCCFFGSTVISDLYKEIPPSCTLTGKSLAGLSSIISKCKEILIKDLEFPAREKMDLKLQDGTLLVFAGNITFGYAEWDGYFITIKGNNVKIIGAPGNLLDGGGARWWDHLGGNGGKSKPKFIRLNSATNTIVRGLNVKNTPKHFFAFKNSENITVSDVVMDNSDGDTQGGHNTDAFGMSESKNLTFTNCRVYNQDDCFAMVSGSSYYFENNFCSGGHGISIGSIGNHNTNTINDVYVKNCTVVNSSNGVRIKTVYNTTGIVTNVRYEDITLGNITEYGLVIRGDYLNSGPTGTPTPGFEISNIYIRNIKGSTQADATNVLILLSEGVASDWTVEDLKIVGGSKRPNCSGIPEDSGLSCEKVNGVIALGYF